MFERLNTLHAQAHDSTSAQALSNATTTLGHSALQAPQLQLSLPQVTPSPSACLHWHVCLGLAMHPCLWASHTSAPCELSRLTYSVGAFCILLGTNHASCILLVLPKTLIAALLLQQDREVLPVKLADEKRLDKQASLPPAPVVQEQLPAHGSLRVVHQVRPEPCCAEQRLCMQNLRQLLINAVVIYTIQQCPV